MVVFIIIVIVVIFLVFLFRDKGPNPTPKIPHSSEHTLDEKQRIMENVMRVASDSYGTYWRNFKSRKPAQAKEIEEVCNRDMSKLSDKDAFEIVTTLLRWSQNANVPISGLKNWFLGEIDNKVGGLPIDQMIETLKKEKISEAKQFNISPEHTACNFMLEFLIQKQKEDTQDFMARKIAKNLNIPNDQVDGFLKNVEETLNSLNIAPDISNLDREENKLFHLAEEGVRMLNHIPTGVTKELVLSREGQAEALILCSTQVIQLHSHFKNEIDLDNKTDRYFLLLSDNTLSLDVDDNTEFLNSRIAFYNEQVKSALALSPLQLFTLDNAYGYLFNALYLHPGNENPTDINPSEIRPNDLVMFRAQLEKTVKYLQSGRKRITGSTNSNEATYRENALAVFNSIIPQSKRSLVNDAIATLLSDQFVSMIKEGRLSPEIPLSSETKVKFTRLVTLGKQLELSETQINDILEDVQNEFINSFSF